jgi:hypothetical protein
VQTRVALLGPSHRRGPMTVLELSLKKAIGWEQLKPIGGVSLHSTREVVNVLRASMSLDHATYSQVCETIRRAF